MSTATLSLRVSKELLERIDGAAAKHGQTRTQYVLEWLPVYYDQTDADTARLAEKPDFDEPGGDR